MIGIPLWATGKMVILATTTEQKPWSYRFSAEELLEQYNPTLGSVDLYSGFRQRQIKHTL